MKKIILVLLMFFVVPSAQAGTIWCSGEINNITLYSSGALYIQGSWTATPSATLLCNTQDEEWGGIDAVVCLQWYGLAKTAFENSQSVVVKYITDSYTCSDLPTFGDSLVPNYFAVAQ